MKLTKKQQEAVEYNHGPMLIIAGAGTGKTLVLVEKIKYLIQKKLAKPEEILALTFTEKAAFEIEERVDKVLPYGVWQTWISTFHSFCDQILRQEASHIGLSPLFKLQTQAESLLYLKKHLFMFDLNYFKPVGNPNHLVQSLYQYFCRLRDEDISFREYLSWIKKKKNFKTEEDKIEYQKNLELAKAYHQFQILKLKDNVLDFADLIFYTIKLFRERKNILKKYQQKFRYILIDEFQDTNIAQYELIKLLAPPKQNPNLCVIGDDNQSIYKFRGASVSNILTFIDDYPQAKIIVLLDNFRSNQIILDAAYRLIKHNDPDTLEAKLNINKNLKSKKSPPSKTPIEFFLGKKVEEEAEFVVKKILNLKKKNYQWSDFAILVRANNHAEPFIKALTQKGIPYQFFGPGILFKRPEVKDLIAYLKVLYDINDSPSLYRVLTMDIFNIDKEDIAKLLSFSKMIGRSLFETLVIYLSFFYPHEIKINEKTDFKKYLFLVKDDSLKKFYQIYKIIRRSLNFVPKETAGQILYQFLEESGYLKKLMTVKTEKEERVVFNISKFFEKLKEFERENEDASVFAVVDFIEMSLELGESPLVNEIDWVENNAVNILTVHSAKGLEFPIVFLVNLTKDRFPTKERKETISLPEELIKEILPSGDYHLEEERRLFYVGLTRAKDYVFLTASCFYGEGKRERKISPFVIETLGEEIIKRKKITLEEEKKQLTIFEFKKEEEKIAESYQNIEKTFSFSQLDTYLVCPLKYRYQYVLKIPTPTSYLASFGETIHQTLEEFYQIFKTKKDLTFNDLIEIYQKKWIPVGYSSKKHEQKTKKEGEKLLKDFWQKFHHQNLEIIDVERYFQIKLDEKINIHGVIDRVDKLADGRIELIDYKTGKKPTGKKIENSLQLIIYAMAASDKNLYQQKLENILLSFIFLADMEKISFTVDLKKIKKVKEQIRKIIKDIRKNHFPANTGIWCQSCPYKINCDAWSSI